jgi:hypothetical protein
VVTMMGHPQWNIRPAGPARPSVLALWSPPGTPATAFFRMMARRGDFQPYQEPFSDLASARHCLLGGRTVTDPDHLLDEILAQSASMPVFFKDTTEHRHCELFADPRLFYEVAHTFIVGDPRGPIEARFAADPRVERAALGYEHVYEIFDLVCEATGRVPVVLDADVLTEYPAESVRAYCAATGIAFDSDALTWDPRDPDLQDPPRQAAAGPGPRPRVEDDPVLAAHYAHHLPFYEKMREHALVVPGI